MHYDLHVGGDGVCVFEIQCTVYKAVGMIFQLHTYMFSMCLSGDYIVPFVASVVLKW